MINEDVDKSDISVESICNSYIKKTDQNNCAIVIWGVYCYSCFAGVEAAVWLLALTFFIHQWYQKGT